MPLGDSQAGGDGGAGMSGPENVMLALAAPQETTDAVLEPQGMKPVPPTGNYLGGVGLVPNVPD